MKVVKSLSHSKKEEVETALKGDHALIHIDARLDDVAVPSHLKPNPALTLKISYLFHGQLTVTDGGIEAYLRFSGNYFQCVVPWSAVWGLTTENGEQKIWNESLPQDLLAQLNQFSSKEVGSELQRAEKQAEVEADSAVTAEDTSKLESKKPTLRRIK